MRKVIPCPRSLKKTRLAVLSDVPSHETVPTTSKAVVAVYKILGIDPGSRISGFAVLAAVKPPPWLPRDLRVVDVGVLRADPKLTLLERIGPLHDAMFDLISSAAPQIFAVEMAFVGKNSQSALKLGQIRGAFLSAASRCSVPAVELSPATVKKRIAGCGQADKVQVCMALKALLGFELGKLPHDASDAVAIALCAGLDRMH